MRRRSGASPIIHAGRADDRAAGFTGRDGVASGPLDKLLADIRACRLCAAHLPLGPRPVLQVGSGARLRIVGQAPGRLVHESGVPWRDASGDRLRAWLGLSPAIFYDPDKVAVLPIGLCYPGRGASGDNPPRPECAPRWHEPVNRLLPHIALTLLVGGHAQAYYLGRRRKASLTETVRDWRAYLEEGFLPLPHTSPRNQPWLAANPWFEAELLPDIRAVIRRLGL